MSGWRVLRLARIGPRELEQLCEVLCDCVDGGASVSFMSPMTRDKAEAFWRGVDQGLARGDRAVVIALDPEQRIIGTTQVIWAPQENQPHRADVAKMLVHRRARRQGVGEALLAAAEQAAREAGRTLLVLDTSSEDAERLYARGGWTRLGRIPGYALLPGGEPCDTVVFYKSVESS